MSQTDIPQLTAERFLLKFLEKTLAHSTRIRMSQHPENEMGRGNLRPRPVKPKHRIDLFTMGSDSVDNPILNLTC